MKGSMEHYLQDNSADDLLEETRYRDEQQPMEDYYKRISDAGNDNDWGTGIGMGYDEDGLADELDDGELDDEDPDLADLPEDRDTPL